MVLLDPSSERSHLILFNFEVETLASIKITQFAELAFKVALACHF